MPKIADTATLQQSEIDALKDAMKSIHNTSSDTESVKSALETIGQLEKALVNRNRQLVLHVPRNIDNMETVNLSFDDMKHIVEDEKSDACLAEELHQYSTYKNTAEVCVLLARISMLDHMVELMKESKHDNFCTQVISDVFRECEEEVGECTLPQGDLSISPGFNIAKTLNLGSWSSYMEMVLSILKDWAAGTIKPLYKQHLDDGTVHYTSMFCALNPCSTCNLGPFVDYILLAFITPKTKFVEHSLQTPMKVIHYYLMDAHGSLHRIYTKSKVDYYDLSVSWMCKAKDKLGGCFADKMEWESRWRPMSTVITKYFPDCCFNPQDDTAGNESKRPKY